MNVSAVDDNRIGQRRGVQLGTYQEIGYAVGSGGTTRWIIGGCGQFESRQPPFRSPVDLEIRRHVWGDDLRHAGGVRRRYPPTGREIGKGRTDDVNPFVVRVGLRR